MTLVSQVYIFFGVSFPETWSLCLSDPLDNLLVSVHFHVLKFGSIDILKSVQLSVLKHIFEQILLRYHISQNV